MAKSRNKPVELDALRSKTASQIQAEQDKRKTAVELRLVTVARQLVPLVLENLPVVMVYGKKDSSSTITFSGSLYEVANALRWGARVWERKLDTEIERQETYNRRVTEANALLEKQAGKQAPEEQVESPSEPPENAV